MHFIHKQRKSSYIFILVRRPDQEAGYICNIKTKR